MISFVLQGLLGCLFHLVGFIGLTGWFIGVYGDCKGKCGIFMGLAVLCGFYSQYFIRDFMGFHRVV